MLIRIPVVCESRNCPNFGKQINAVVISKNREDSFCACFGQSPEDADHCPLCKYLGVLQSSEEIENTVFIVQYGFNFEETTVYAVRTTLEKAIEAAEEYMKHWGGEWVIPANNDADDDIYLHEWMRGTQRVIITEHELI